MYTWRHLFVYTFIPMCPCMCSEHYACMCVFTSLWKSHLTYPFLDLLFALTFSSAQSWLLTPMDTPWNLPTPRTALSLKSLIQISYSNHHLSSFHVACLTTPDTPFLAVQGPSYFFHTHQAPCYLLFPQYPAEIS